MGSDTTSYALWAHWCRSQNPFCTRWVSLFIKITGPPSWTLRTQRCQENVKGLDQVCEHAVGGARVGSARSVYGEMERHGTWLSSGAPLQLDPHTGRNGPFSFSFFSSTSIVTPKPAVPLFTVHGGRWALSWPLSLDPVCAASQAAAAAAMQQTQGLKFLSTSYDYPQHTLTGKRASISFSSLQGLGWE